MRQQQHSYGPNGATFYISNCQRDDIIKLYEEMIDKLRKGQMNP